MTTIRIWHKKKHDDFTVTEIETDTPSQFAIDAFRAGGYWHNDVFIPWHSISYIQAEYDK